MAEAKSYQDDPKHDHFIHQQFIIKHKLCLERE